ncbi:hypothetical protein [Rhodopirellula sp. MGV]|uniref:hypothetical protein n=1 Tax=Rhodopirellula sp. MGV TaxID=2023130 RepID=UPI000B97C609|nr:hypothetical protein [Rhodopirellula sp. MGV]OYP34390.1 hypothetical protein CGZ80_15145 [Rhodopirellula sp. MGV]PNY37436.1 hypothetical protein C2E31_07880 [Rhodopirellula baltica]
MASLVHSRAATLLTKVTCPHCWSHYAPEESLWISEHPDLLGDAKLGFQHPKRFLPSRFTPQGDAIDEMGQYATRMACPKCHLHVPRSMYQVPSLFFSIFGAPACGKSYFLTSLSWKLRQTLPKRFAVSLSDVDAETNSRIHEYEEQQFMNPDLDTPVALAKTEEQGDMYDTVNMGDHTVTFPRPFMFNLQPLSSHPRYQRNREISKLVCLYDNAGESFFPGADKTISPVTRHLARSKCLFFCFDPTQDTRFRRACEGKSNDPQMASRTTRLARETTIRQDTILLEAIQRVRRHAGLRDDELHQRPLVIIVTKWDAWRNLLPDVSTDEPYLPIAGSKLCSLDSQRIKSTSERVGELMSEICPEIVAAAEGFSTSLTFIPVSASGTHPTLDPATGALGIRPRDMNPFWVEVPMLMALHNWAGGLVGASAPGSGMEDGRWMQEKL